MFKRLGEGIARRPKLTLIICLLLLAAALAGTFGGFGHGGLFERLSNTAADTPGTESEAVNDALGQGDATGDSITLVVEGVTIPDDVPELISFMADERETFSEIDGVEQVADPFVITDPTNPMPNFEDPAVGALLSSESDGFVVAITLDPDLDSDAKEAAHVSVGEAADSFASALADEFGDTTVSPLSTRLIGNDINKLVQDDLVRGESIGLPVALLLLVIVFGGLLAAGLPLVGAVVSIGLGMAGIWALTFAMDINSFILNVISIIGLALSIDYGLLVVSRYREEIANQLGLRGYPPTGTRTPTGDELRELVNTATINTVATAGRTVFFSALTIAFAIAGLLVFSSSILQSIALGGILVTLLAVLTAITLIPALMVLMGGRLVRPSLLTRIPVLKQITRAVGDASSDHGFFSKIAAFVHRIPWLVIVGVVAIMAVLAAPLGGLQLRTNFIEYLPAGSPTLRAYQTLQDDYPALASPEIVAVADVAPADASDLIDEITASNDAVEYVFATPLPDDENRTRLDIHLDAADRVGPDVVDFVTELRDLDPGYGFIVGGDAAMQHDFITSLAQRAPFALAIVVLAVFVLLFLMTGSLMIPLKALIINVFSLAAALGATVWLFEGGHLGMPQTPGLETFIVACMVAFGFGLSMDYEVFLVARIKEYWDAGLSNDEAVERGLQRSGRIITSAAAIIVAVFIGFVAGEMLAIKQIGVALAIMVVMDATLVRMLLVPATMTIMGRWNWWAPGPLRRLYERFKITH